jgi:hypothetical protein
MPATLSVLRKLFPTMPSILSGLPCAAPGTGKLTQRRLAEMSGIPQRHISEMENGKRQIGRERAKKLADALHVADYRVFL